VNNEKDPWTNRVSDIFPELPTNCAEPLERITRSREGDAGAEWAEAPRAAFPRRGSVKRAKAPAKNKLASE